MKRAIIDVAVFCATKNEAVAVRRVQEGPFQQIRCGVKRASIANLGPLICLTVASGLGETRIERAFQALVEEYHVRLLINFGAAGAVRPALPIGAPTIPRELVAYSWPELKQEGETIRIQAGRVENAHKMVRITRAGSCAHDIRDAQTRDRLRDNLQVDTTDWESYTIASLCRSQKIDFLALRCITDRADASAGLDYGRSASQVLEKGAVILEPMARVWLKAGNDVF